ncbi:MAG: c-type cytochrome biogenesis protein CcsB [Desulfuromonadales bacterium]|nr:c-type cytochrome biogenesis protein CcsB [Desulfuromonadales bacterium]MDT8423450.1 c-type cytochrome biogenesis protein CcsB [Desulfuromonadales bacterium]
MSVNLLLFKITLLLYFVATVFYLIDVLAQKDVAGKMARWVLSGGFLLHCITLGARWIEAGHAPMASLHESLSFFAWAIVGIFLLFDLRYRLAVLGAFCTPLALGLMIFSLGAPREIKELNPILDTWWFPVHVSLAFAGYAVFAIAFAAGIMYLIQERLLKKKRFSGLYFRLPALNTLDSINYKCLSFGFPLMTMGIVSGAIWANMAWGGYWRWDPKETWALITWFLYAALLHGRLTVGWRGRRAAIFSIIGFLCLLFSFLCVNWFLSGEHSFRALAGG